MSHNQEEKSLQNECPCHNGGRCYINPGSSKICQCPNGFTGTFCETSICKFNVESIRQKKKKANVCFLVTRINSRQVSCTQSSCQNGGTCQGQDSVCICKPGFTGQRCESGMIN